MDQTFINDVKTIVAACESPSVESIQKAFVSASNIIGMVGNAWTVLSGHALFAINDPLKVLKEEISKIEAQLTLPHMEGKKGITLPFNGFFLNLISSVVQNLLPLLINLFVKPTPAPIPTPAPSPAPSPVSGNG